MEVVSNVLLVAGALWFNLAALGVARLGDAMGRIHASTKATTLGLIMVVSGAMLRAPGPEAVKLSLAIALVAITAPIGGHLLGRATALNPGTARVRIDIRVAPGEQAGDAREDEPEAT